MTQKIAHQRYMRIFVPAMVLYVVSIIGIRFVRAQGLLPDFVFYGLAQIPAISILIWVWGHMRYITELDEHLRELQVRAVMIGVAGTLVFATGWGLMEEITHSVRIPIIYIVPGFYLIFGIAHTVLMKREGSCLRKSLEKPFTG